MRLFNGLVFGAGTGLISTGITGMANGHVITVYILGALLILTAISRFLCRA